MGRTEDSNASGVFATVSFSEADVDHVLGRAIDAVAREELVARIECIGLDEREAIVLADRDKLERAFVAVLSASVRSARRGSAVRVALRRAPRAWSVRIEHALASDATHGAAELHDQLSFARAVIVGHEGEIEVLTDASRTVCAIVVSLPAPSTF